MTLISLRIVFVTIGAAAVVGVMVTERNPAICVIVGLALGIGLGTNLALLVGGVRRQIEQMRFRRWLGPMPERMQIHHDRDGWYILSPDGAARLPRDFDPFRFDHPAEMIAYLRDFYAH